MISFAPTDEQRLVCDITAHFAAKALAPAARGADEGQGFSPELLDRIWALGLVANIAANPGALQQQPALLNVQALERLAEGDATAAMALAGPLGFVKAVAEQGSERQKDSLLPLFAGASFYPAAVAHGDEMGAGQTSASITPSGYAISGRKSLVPFADRCGHFLVTALCDGALEAFLVPRETAGV